MKRTILKLTLLLISIFTSIALFAFDWPQDNINNNSYKTYFGQYRGENISTSITFTEPSIIKASEDGDVLIVIEDEDNMSDFFPSTLGTCVILSHQDNLLSVYGNLEKTSITSTITNQDKVYSGDLIGESGNSAWQEKVSSLEFQIIDTKNTLAINPKVLMPRHENEQTLTISEITLENKNGESYDLLTHKTLSTGLYKIYQKRNPVVTPYKSTIFVNGIIVDQINYDIIVQENNKNCLLGKKKYTKNDIYPDENRELLGEAMFTAGRTTLSLVVTDITNKSKQATYNITFR